VYREDKPMYKAHPPDPCAGSGTCLVPPAEFVRLRYFFGQRLGVVDLVDEQSYLSGKQRFHNLRAHGVGILCGLRAERYVPKGSKTTTLLKVCRGAALDGSGREVIVGWDQCIDVAAWYAQHPGAGTPLWVALCYRECPSDPAPAPRDPCGCDAGGCEFARIREAFELKLLTDAEAKLLAANSQQPEGIDLVAEEIIDDPIDSAYARAATILAGTDCTEPPADACLLLANFQATLDSTKTVVDITPPDNSIAERLSLLPTAVLQQSLLHALTAAGDAELIGAGPRFGAVTFQGASAVAGKLSIDILPKDTALSVDPFPAQQLKVSAFRFQDNGTWTVAATPTPMYVPGPPPQINLTWSSGLDDGGRYRLLLRSDRKQPPVDQRMRPLTPLSWARHFRLVKDNNTGLLQLADSLYP
jgi:hypothetical protein